MARVFTTEIGVEHAGDTAELQLQISGRAPELSLEQRDKRKLAKRIIGAVQPVLEDALKKESDLSRKPYEAELKELDSIFEKNSVLARRESGGDTAVDVANDEQDEGEPQQPATSAATADGFNGVERVEHADTSGNPATGADGYDESGPKDITANPSQPAGQGPNNEEHNHTNDIIKENYDPLTPPLSHASDQQQGSLAQGGVQWYMQPFDPEGTTIHEERWIGRDVMSEDDGLSELDDEEMQGLVDDNDDEDDDGTKMAGHGQSPPQSQSLPVETPTDQQPAKVHMTRSQMRGRR